MPAAVRRFDLASAAYLATLDAYIHGRLPPGPRDDAALRAAIVAAADRRFAYVAFLAERCAQGKADRDSLLAAVAREGDAGQALYRRWLRDLGHEYGPKLAGPMREVLAMLWAAKRAHAWVFGAGRVQDPATGGALTPLPAAFEGLSLDTLQALLLHDRPGRAYSPELLLILQQMQGVLAIHRGDGASRFRIGLKDLGPAVERDEALAPMIPRAHLRLAVTALEALEAADQARAGGKAPVDQLPGWALFDELAPYLDAALALAGCEPLAARWRARGPRPRSCKPPTTPSSRNRP